MVARKTDPAPDRSVSAAERTMTILNAFLAHRNPLSLTELEACTGLFKSVILRYMITLVRESMVRKNPDGTYQLGTKVLKLSHAYEQSVDRLDLIKPSLERLVAASGETASFYVREGETRICLFRHNSPHSLRVSLQQGDTMPLDETSTGQVLRHAEGAPMVDGIGIRQTVGLIDPLTTSIATPVFGARETLVGALTLSGPIGRFDPSGAQIRRRLMDEAERLSAAFGSSRYDTQPTAERDASSRGAG